ARVYAVIAGFFSILIPALLWWLVATRYEQRAQLFIARYTPQPAVWVLVALLLIMLTWGVAWMSLQTMDLILRSVPRVRRKLRPWLQRHGVKILPPRHRKLEESDEPIVIEDEIIE